MFHCIITRYSSRFAPIIDAIVRLSGCKAYENKPYTIVLTLYGPRKQLEIVVPFGLICAVEIVTLNRYPVETPVHIINRPYMFSTPRNKPSKSGFHLSLYVQYT